MDNKKIKARPAVMLDVDDTLLDFKKAERAALTKAFTKLGLPTDDNILSEYSEINISQWELLEEGKLSRRQVLEGRFDILFKRHGLDFSGAQANALYEELLAIGHYFIDGAPELLEALKGKYDLYIASNGVAKVQAGRLASAGIEPYFKGIFISETMGADKPGKEYFDRCFAQMEGFDPQRTIIVGDSLTSDIRGGINAGIKTCWFNHRRRPEREDIKPDWVIYSLAELPPLLERIFG